MSAAEVLAQHLRGGMPLSVVNNNVYYSCLCGERPLTIEGHSSHLLDALKAAGFAVVQLPMPTIVPTGWNEECGGAWPTGRWIQGVGDDPVGSWPGREVSLPDFLDHAHGFISSDRARRLAAALLAAADAAEARS